MDITIKIDGICAGGNHIHITATASGKDVSFVLTKADFQLTPDEWETALIVLLKSFVKKSGLTNWGQIKTAIEAEVFKI